MPGGLHPIHLAWEDPEAKNHSELLQKKDRGNLSRRNNNDEPLPAVADGPVTIVTLGTSVEIVIINLLFLSRSELSLTLGDTQEGESTS